MYPHPHGKDTRIKPTINSKAPTRLSKLSIQSKRSLRYCRTRATDEKHTAVRMQASKALLKQKVVIQHGCLKSPAPVKVIPVSVATSGSPSALAVPAPRSSKALHIKMSILSHSSAAALCSQRFNWICALSTACLTSLVKSCTVVTPDTDMLVLKRAPGVGGGGSSSKTPSWR